MNPFKKEIPKTTEAAIAHFSKGIDILRDVFDNQSEKAESLREDAEEYLRQAANAENDADHASRIIKRFTEFVS